MDAFDQAFGFVIGYEGGYSDTAADQGNWTSHGWRKKKLWKIIKSFLVALRAVP